MSSKAVRETVGFLGGVASLVFVGLEIRQNTATARGQARQELAALNQEWLIQRSTATDFQATQVFKTDAFDRFWTTGNERGAYDPGFVRFLEARIAAP